MHPDIEQIVLDEAQLAARVRELGALVTEHYAGRVGDEGLLVAVVLRGAAVFAIDLIRCIDVPVQLDFIQASSYGNEAHSSGVVRITKDVEFDLSDRHVLIVEDIVDSGRTLHELIAHLQQRGAASVEAIALLHKDVPGQLDVPCLATGFECPDGFIVGYGLDYAQRYRNLPYIGTLKPHLYQD